MYFINALTSQIRKKTPISFLSALFTREKQLLILDSDCFQIVCIYSTCYFFFNILSFKKNQRNYF